MERTISAEALQSAADFIKCVAERDFPNETCGILDGEGRPITARNISLDPERQFKISPRWLADQVARRGIFGIYHSHINRPALPSKDDLQGLKVFGVWYIIASVFQGNCQEIRAYTSEFKDGRPWLEPIGAFAAR